MPRQYGVGATRLPQRGPLLWVLILLLLAVGGAYFVWPQARAELQTRLEQIRSRLERIGEKITLTGPESFFGALFSLNKRGVQEGVLSRVQPIPKPVLEKTFPSFTFRQLTGSTILKVSDPVSPIASGSRHGQHVLAGSSSPTRAVHGGSDSSCVVGKSPMKWRHFGRDPYAPSREEAMANRKDAFTCLVRAMELPAGVSVELVVFKMLEATQHSGTLGYLEKGDQVLAMLSRAKGKVVVNKMVTIDFDRPAVNGMEYVAEIETWTIKIEVPNSEFQEFIDFGDPTVCNNWLVLRIHRVPKTLPPRTALAMPCAEIDFDVLSGDTVRFGAIVNKKMPPECWARFDEVSETWVQLESPCDGCDWSGPLSVVPPGYMLEYTFRYVATSDHQRIRVPLALKQQYPTLCDWRIGFGDSDAWVISPVLWRTDVYHVPEGVPGATWPVWGREALALQAQRGITIR